MAYWIQNINIKKGALHRQLGYPKSKKIPVSVLRKIKNAKVGSKITVNGKRRTVTTLLKRRAVLALNLEKARRKK